MVVLSAHLYISSTISPWVFVRTFFEQCGLGFKAPSVNIGIYKQFFLILFSKTSEHVFLSVLFVYTHLPYLDDKNEVKHI